jgi:beta-phosphoglucomutase-like phosphatase (HAD superfamily)
MREQFTASSSKLESFWPVGAVVKAVIFDIDGTLLDSVDLHAESWVTTFAHFGIEANFHEVRSHIGEGADRLLPAFVPSGTSKARKNEIEKFRSHLFKNQYLPRVQPFVKVKELFERIKRDGRKAILASSCTEDEIAQYKKIAGISDIVDCESTSDDAESSKPAPDIFLKAVERVAPIKAQECIVIGDTHYDGEAARKAGIPFIGVLCGGSETKSGFPRYHFSCSSQAGVRC